MICAASGKLALGTIGNWQHCRCTATILLCSVSLVCNIPSFRVGGGQVAEIFGAFLAGIGSMGGDQANIPASKASINKAQQQDSEKDTLELVNEEILTLYELLERQGVSPIYPLVVQHYDRLCLGADN